MCKVHRGSVPPIQLCSALSHMHSHPIPPIHTFTRTFLTVLCLFADKLYIKSQPKSHTVLVGTSVTLECEFRAHYANPVTNRLDLQWFHYNPEVLNDTRRTIYTPSPPGRSMLVIKNVSRTDDGNYTCKAQLNGTEDINQVIVLNVISEPHW